MDGRWLLLGVGLCFGGLALVFASQGRVIQTSIAVVFTSFGLGGFWWNTTREDPIETSFSRSR